MEVMHLTVHAAEGPFVMNSLEIAYAYRDFYSGKYGQIVPIKKYVSNEIITKQKWIL